MGNFSVNRYGRVDLRPGTSTLTYVLDLAEIPTFELLERWKIETPTAELVQQKGEAEARLWLSRVALAVDGRPVSPVLRRVKTQLQDGAGGMPVLRVEAVADLALGSGRLTYRDGNFAERAGWKEVVIRRGNGVAVSQSSVSGRDLSQALTAYPADLTVAPPQVSEASVTYTMDATPAPVAPEPVTPVATPSFAAPVPQGTVVRGDYLSRLLKNRDLTLGMMLLGLGVAFGLGAMHALSPGHGKTIVAAYLVGSRGTLKHALFLGAMVTFTHTVSVFALGLGVLYFQETIVPERVIPWLGAASGVSILAIGAYLLYQRTMNLSDGHEHHHHAPSQLESVGEAVEGQPSFLSRSQPTAFLHQHTHDGHTHSHVMPEEVTMKGLMTLGASGGLVPCPSALVLMLSAIAVGHTGLGLALLVAFSAGLAIVLMAIGGLVIYAKHLLPEPSPAHPFLRFVPVLSAAVVMMLGALMTMTSLGILQAPFAS